MFDHGQKETDGGEQQEPEQQLGRRARKKLAVEQRIRATAIELFKEKGYEATTVEAIAERADVAKGTVFNYFPRKDALLEALAEDFFDEVFDELGPVSDWSGTARDQLLRLFTCIGRLVRRDPELSKIMIVENLRRYWLQCVADPLELQFRELVCTVLQRGVDASEFAAETELTVTSKLLEAAYFTTMIDCMRRGAEFDVYERELTIKLDTIFRGLGATAPAQQ